MRRLDFELIAELKKIISFPLSSFTSPRKSSFVNASRELSVFNVSADTAAQMMSLPASAYPAWPLTSIPFFAYSEFLSIVTVIISNYALILSILTSV